jgi:formate dehydrogenase subunit gamma
MSNPPPEPGPSVVRHSGQVRFLHWSLALAYVIAIATGFALYWERLLGWLVPLFGGHDRTVYIHFWAGIALTLFGAYLYLAWRRQARWNAADSDFVRNMREHALHPERDQPPDTGFFNGGQKLYFWAVVLSGAIFLITGIVWSYRYQVPKDVYAVCRTTHRIFAVIMAGGLLVHIYKATIGEPGTFRSMLSGKVSREWARKRRPKWFRDLKD